MTQVFNGPVVIKGELSIPGPVRPEPAAQFGSHVGVEGNLDVTGNVHLKNGASLTVDGPVRPAPAAQFGSHVGVEGNLDVAGDIQLLNADCAEEFEISDEVEEDIHPGSVVVLGRGGSVQCSVKEYDKRVAGVVAGAGCYKPAIVLDKKADSSSRIAVALMGKVFCRVDARYGSIEIGDLLTTSRTPGHAMKASDSSRAFGAVIGKSLGDLTSGFGLVPVLVSLQ